MITAFKKIPFPCKLIIWGRPLGQNTASLKRLAADSSNPIVFKGEYDNKDIIKEVFEKTDAIVVPSIWGENSPLVIHEAQACHIPVITADFGGMKEYVQYQVNGLLFEHRNPKDLATKLQWAVNHPKEMRQFGERGYLYAENGKVPEIQQHCRQLTQIYQQQITKNGN